MALARSHRSHARQDLAVRLRGLCVADIMSRRIVTVRPDMTLCDAAHLMIGQRISGMPVVDDGEKLVGLVTEADFLRALGIPSHHPSQSVWHTLEALFAHDTALKEECSPVSEIMVTDVVCAIPEWSVVEVIDAMKRYRVKRLIVCDAPKHVCGMVTRSDLVRVFIVWMSGRGVPQSQ